LNRREASKPVAAVVEPGRRRTVGRSRHL